MIMTLNKKFSKCGVPLNSGKNVPELSKSFDIAENILGKIKRTYKNRCGSRRIFNFHNYDGYLIFSQLLA